MLHNSINEERNPQINNIDRRIQRLHFGGRGSRGRGRGWRGRRGARGQGRNVHIHNGNVYIYYK